MEGRFLMGSNEKPVEGNIYSDKSAVVLDWLLTRRHKKSRVISTKCVERNWGKPWIGTARLWDFSFKRNFASRKELEPPKSFS